ncbi:MULTISPECIES: hypothetical protein [Paenibacillus]|jgi:hypothetical protein|uniref:hypothetical protein n=1 Tax=Paenibacillus TaxID=44249 RepID=UPI0004B725E4|nr:MULTISPECIES: hypothetical protein [Paenibacillus]MEC2343422.1 hypothetical protein [Paenibacillus barengoltzii]SME89577.1 hypothetical protein SAMN02744102_00152 [Paenibacillus barengoltzii]
MGRTMVERKQRPFIFVSIRASTIRNFIILDLITGTGLYYLIKVATASVLLGSMGSAVGTEVMKRIRVMRLFHKNRSILPVRKKSIDVHSKSTDRV